MIVRNEGQALCIAVEMERRAIRIYERAMMITADERVKASIQDILRDEKEHLRRFSAMKGEAGLDEQEERMLMQAMAAEMLFPGGVMEMERSKALSTMRGLYAFASESEQDAVEKYGAFAQKCANPKVRQTFLAIAKEEASHLTDLREKLESME